MATKTSGPSSDAFGVTLADPVTLRHGNRLIVMAREAKAACNSLYFIVFDEKLAMTRPDSLAWSGWYRFDFDLGTTGTVAGNVRFEEAQPAPELRLGGMDLITLPLAVQPLSAGDFAFRAYNDGQAIAVFRVSDRRSLLMNRLTLVESTVKEREEAVTRFALQTSWETRFKYSGKRDVPADDLDSLSYQDALGRPFLEPSLELPRLDPGASGLFDVIEVPTANADLKAIYIVVNFGADFRLHRLERHSDGFIDFSGDSETIQPLVPILEPGQVALTPIAGLAPAVAYYGEQDPAGDGTGDPVELQRLGRLAVAMPVAGAGLTAAMAIFDYALDGEGRVVDLAPAEQTAPLVDGTVSGGSFTPDDSSPVFPTAANILAVTGLRVNRMVLGQVQPKVSPLLYMGDDGLIHLYYGGPPLTATDRLLGQLDPNLPEAMVVQCDTRVTRLVLSVPWTLSQKSEEPPGKLYFNALLGGPLTRGASVEVTKTTFNATGPADLRDVAIGYPAGLGLEDETWVGVPADVTQFAAVLNGEATSDSADSNARRGLRTFFDYGGERSILRVPVTSAMGETLALQFISALPGVSLESLKITATGGGLTYAFTAISPGGTPIAVTWAGVPAVLSAYGDIFEGIADPETYAYPADAGATLLWSLATDGVQSFTPLLFCAAGGAPPPELTFAVADGNAAGTVTVEVAHALGGTLVVSDVPADVAGFVAALAADSKFAALGLEIIDSGAAGRIVATDGPRGRLNLAGTSALFDLLLPAVALDLFTPTPQTYPAGGQGHHCRGSGKVHPSDAMAGFVATFDPPSAGIAATVDIATAQPSVNRVLHGASAPDLHGPLWRRQEPVMACSFDGTDAVVIPVESGGTALAKAISLRLQPRWTLETWIMPVGSGQQQVISYRDNTITPAPGAPKMEYALGVKGQHVVALASYSNFSGNDSSYFHSQVSPNASVFPDREFTWECWLQPQATPAPSGSNPVPLGVVFQYGANPSVPQFAFGLDSTRNLHIQTRDSMNKVVDFKTHAVLPAVDANNDPLWSHVALVGRKAKSGTDWAIEVVVDGELLQTFTGVPITPGLPPALSIGGGSLDNSSLFGQITQLRVWNFARTRSEIRRTAMVTITGTEFGLLGSWPMGTLHGSGSGRYLRNDALVTGSSWDAVLFVSAKQPVTMPEDGFFLSVVAAIGGKPAVEAPALLRNGAWNHVAVVYEAGGALRMNPSDRFDAGNYDWMEIEQSQSLDVGRQFAIDAWVIVPSDNNLPGTLIARWDEDRTEGDCGLRLLVERDGSLTFEVAYVADLKGKIAIATMTSKTLKVADGKPHHIAAVFASTEQVTQQGGGTTDPTYTMTLYVDGSDEASTPVSVPGMASVQVNNPDRPVLVGRGFLPPPNSEPVADEAILFYRGTLGELRFWSTAPARQALFPELYPRLPRVGLPRGLAARWSFTEQDGYIATDDVGDADGSLSTSSMWSPFEATSAMRIYSNGALVGSSDPFPGSFSAGTVDQLAFGAPGGGVAGIAGRVARVSLYGTIRNAESIEAQKNVPSDGAERDLLACWDFSGGGQDITGGGNDPVPPIAPARLAPSDAPISNEGPYVRNAYGGRVTNASMSAPGRIAVGNYVDVTSPGTDAQQTVLKRQFVMEPGQTFTAPIQIGELALTFIGQVQTDPTLIGYIEGAPPVPSENLTRPYYKSAISAMYANASSVTLVQESGSEVTFTSQSAAASQIDVSGAIGPAFVNRLDTSAGSGFFNLVDSNLNFENKVQAQFKSSTEWGSGETSGFAGNWATRQSFTMALGGEWEQAPYLNPVVGRRFIAANLGYALVESLTADLYSMVFRSSGASLGTIVLPNPDIPPDRNIILFPIKVDKYTKASTLDGKVGLVNDPEFRDADIRRGSYYRPLEAYATQSRIEFQQQRALAFAVAFDAQGKGQDRDGDLTAAGNSLPARPDNGASQDDQTAGQLPALIPAQGIVNKFVWTSDGGGYSEQHNYGSKATKAFTGYKKIGGGAGLKGEGKFLLKFGFAWSLDFLGSHLTRIDTSNTLTSSSALSLTVTATGESGLRNWDDLSQALMPQPAPGKVRAYRFSTFYLPPSVQNGIDFDGIVDPVWRRLSNDPMARALRELRIENPVWRVFHRATYVERVPPPAATGPSFAPPATVRPPVNVEGNIALCQLVEEQLRKQGSRHDRLSVANAVAAVINPVPTAPGVYPASVLEHQFAWWRDFLASARPDTQGTIASPGNAKELARIQSDTVTYMYAGYTTGAIPKALAAP